MNTQKKGAHNVDNLQHPKEGMASVTSMYTTSLTST